jgi:radical SAM protein with 4Fe4S-binding SPASM domain
LKHFFEKSYNIAVSRNKPVSLIHFVTNQCNARCPHCFIDFENEVTQKDSISLDNLEKMTKQVGNQLMNVNLTGGEPFLDPNLEEICLLYLKNTSIDSLFFSTNGAMTSKILRVAENLSNRYPNVIYTYSISIDLIGEKHDDYRRVKNLYQKAIDTYNKLEALPANVQPNITITVCDDNADDIEEIFNKLFFKEGVKSITANIVRDEGVFSIDPESIKKLNRAYSKLTQLISKHDAQYSGENYLARMMNEKEKIMYKYINNIYANPEYVLPCRAGAGLMGVIYPNGDVYPCEVLDKKMGNLYDYDMNLLKLWDDNQKLRSWIKKSKCHCTYECAWSYNILSSPKHMAKLAVKGI